MCQNKKNKFAEGVELLNEAFGLLWNCLFFLMNFIETLDPVPNFDLFYFKVLRSCKSCVFPWPGQTNVAHFRALKTNSKNILISNFLFGDSSL